jgi:hypothetical protein
MMPKRTVCLLIVVSVVLCGLAATLWTASPAEAQLLNPPQILLEVHPNERAPGITGVNRMPGTNFSPWPVLGAGGRYSWKEYDFVGSQYLWIQVCAQNFSAYQNQQNGSYVQEDFTLLRMAGVPLVDFWGIQTGPPGGFQWRGSTDKGTRLVLEFFYISATPGYQVHQMVFHAQMSPIIWWIKVYDLEQRYID